jgi:hypothetical protein
MGSTLFLLGKTFDDDFAHLTSVQLSFSHHRVHSPHLVGRAEGIQISRALSDLCSALKCLLGVYNSSTSLIKTQ